MAVTLVNLRQPLARTLDDLETHTVAGGAVNSLVSGSLVNNLPGASAERYQDRYAYVYSGTAVGQQSQVYIYGPSTGSLTITPNMSVGPAIGDLFELTSNFPSVAMMGSDTDYRTIIRRALSLLYLKTTDTLAIVGASTVSLSSDQANWLSRADQIDRWLEAAPVANRAQIDASWRGIRLVFGVAPYIVIDQPFTGTLSFDAWRPADSLVNGAYSAVGPTADADVTYAQPRDVIMVGLMLAYQILANRNAGRPTGGWASKYMAQLDLIMKQHAARFARGDRSLELAAEEAAQQQAAVGGG